MEKQKQEMADKIKKALSSEIELIRTNKDKTLEQKMLEVDVLLDTIKFLDNYEEHTKVLNNYIAKKRGIER